ncbi:aminotransferase class IV [Ornithinimicrobium faecis]|uniref:aminotransferase class IV n=1 Tax=Ornithinimicrobium faecis TaxID=2934158 RepID=UPI0021187F50|nr:aminotransferase class IV [Ornithinimicrobium sp. HY1745]
MSADQIRVWVDGQRVDEGPAIAAVDHGVTVGDGVFETAKIVDGQVFARTRHHDRMDRSLAGLGLPALDRAHVDEGVEAVLADGPISFGRLRYTITGGIGPLGSDRMDSPMTYIVVAGELQRPAPVTTVAVVPWIRNERAATVGLKTTSYAENVVALSAAKSLGATEAIFANGAGELCEGTGSNIFIVRDGVIFTPPLEAGPLAGITRALTIEWCREEGLEVVEEAMPLSVLAECDEAFLTSSTRDVQAIGAIRIVPAQQTAAGEIAAVDLADRGLSADPGPVTQRAAEIFARLSKERMDP